LVSGQEIAVAERSNKESRKRKGKMADGQKGKTTPKRRRKARRKGPSFKGTTKRARERSPEAIDPKVAIIAKDPLRAEILAVAIQRLYSPSEFAREKGISLGVASYAFKVLKEHDIIELVKVRKVRGAIKHMYRANEAAFIGDKDWGALTPVLRPGVIGATFGNFNGRVAEAEETGKLYSREDVRIYWAPREFDEIAWAEHAEILAWCIEESERLEAETVERRAKGESDGAVKATVGLFLFPSPTHAEVKEAEKQSRRGERQAKAKPKAAARAKRKGAKARAKSSGKKA
jgi:DNA-binding transcriptional ArsR family regulator